MKREELNRIFENATKEQIDQVMALNGADVTREQQRSRAELEELTARLNRAGETIRALEESAGDADKLRSEIEAYKWAELKRAEEERSKAERAELMERLDAVLAGRKFVSDRLREPVADDFAAALRDKRNRGRTDAAIFEEMTRDKGYFVSQNPAPENMGAFAAIDSGRSRTAAMRAAMDLPLGKCTPKDERKRR